MKHLLTIISCIAVFSMSAQTDYPFPWNPDADLDGWVSTEDLLLLLTVFGTQFEPDTWETDSISAAVVLDGNHNYFQCQSYCNDIEGNWRMADLDAFGRHFDLASSVSATFWVNSNDKLNSSEFNDAYQLYGPNGNLYSSTLTNLSSPNKCMCYIQSSPFVPSQYIEDSNLALWGSVSDLQEQVDSLQTALDSLQTSSTAVDSISSPSSQFSFECVDMGVASNCYGDVNPLYLESDDNYTYYLSSSCQTTWYEGLVAPTWRKFCVSGLDVDVEEINFGFEYRNQYGDQLIDVSVEHLAEVSEGTACFTFFSNNTSMIYSDNIFEDGVPPFNVLNSIGGSTYGKIHFKVLIETDGYYSDTGIRFTR